MVVKTIRSVPILLLVLILLDISCTRKNIDFGQDLANSYTNLVLIDTVGVTLSTVISDSFETGTATSFLVGKYHDPYLGIIAAKPFFQMSIPASAPTLPVTAQYDSLGLIIHFNKYYYGDTTRLQTITVNELAQPITFDVDDKLYNTSDFPVKIPSLGSINVRIGPTSTDSLHIRLNDAKGMELFSKIEEQSTDIASSGDFVNYFKGISLSTGAGDTTAIYGLTDSIVMRLYYHTTTPFPTAGVVDFPFQANTYAFQQLRSNRSGTGITGSQAPNGTTEISAAQTNDVAFLQGGTGVRLKMTFPSLRSILSTDKIVRLLKAELILRPAYRSFDRNHYPLPDPVFLQQTDGTNIAGPTIQDSTGSAIQNISPVIDDLYGENNYYRFNVTPYINTLLTTTGTNDKGFFVMNNWSTSNMNVTRLVMNNSLHGAQSSELLLSVLVINK